MVLRSGKDERTFQTMEYSLPFGRIGATRKTVLPPKMKLEK